MRGKKINYNQLFLKSFKKLAQIYLIERDKKEKIIQSKIWEIDKNAEVLSFDDIKKMKKNVALS